MNRIYEIFIPFIDMETSSMGIERILLKQNFGQIIDIKIHEKKINQNGKFRSANHKFAFITMYIFNTIPGNNMIDNIKNNKITHIMFKTKYGLAHWDLKRYKSIKERIDKGYDLHIENLQKKSFYDSILEKKECENDYKEIETELNKYYTTSSE